MRHHSELVSRRAVLRTGAGGALAVALTAEASESDAPHDVYAELGVQPIINAAGTITRLGGSIMPAEVLAAWREASRSFVNLAELQDRVGEAIAELLKVESALVTTGAAGGIVVGTAAALTFRDHGLIGRLPLPPEMGAEVIRQQAHRACYDNQVTACGVRLIDVTTRAELERAISPRTAMMFSYNVHQAEGQISQPDWIEVARRHQIPTLLDAAADTPPLEALSKYNQMGFDMVVFSGGKALRGPQDAGLLLGRQDLIAAAKLNTAPNCGNIGRGLKVSKEDMVGMWAAVKRFVQLDHAAQWRQWEQRIETIAAAVEQVPSVRTAQIVPPIANQVPHLLVFWDQRRLNVSYADMKRRLAAGRPSIATARVHGTGQDGFLVSVFMLQEGEDAVVAARMREILATG